MTELLLLEPRGFCRGVIRARSIVEEVLATVHEPIYMRKQLVHNPRVIQHLRSLGLRFVDEIGEVPKGAAVILSAHGVAPVIYAEARRKQLRIIDATCPIVRAIHRRVARYVRAGYAIIFIGHEGHEEVTGIMGEGGAAMRLICTPEEARSVDVPDQGRVVFFTQTTLTMRETLKITSVLRERFPEIEGPTRGNLCYATEERQKAVIRATEAADVVIVIGGKNSSNCRRLCEVAQAEGVDAYLVESWEEIVPGWWQDREVVAVTAGASTPEESVREVVGYFRSAGVKTVKTLKVARA